MTEQELAGAIYIKWVDAPGGGDAVVIDGKQWYYPRYLWKQERYKIASRRLAKLFVEDAPLPDPAGAVQE